MRSLYDAQTLAAPSPVHAIGIYRGEFTQVEVFVRKTKAFKQSVKLEGARLAKSHNGEWSDATVRGCNALADRILSHGPGRRSANRMDLRSKLPDVEIPASHLDINALSPITYLYP